MASDKVSLRDIYEAINHLEDKIGKRVDSLEARVNVTESKVDSLIGKIGLGVAIFMAVIGSGVAFVFDQFKKN